MKACTPFSVLAAIALLTSCSAEQQTSTIPQKQGSKTYLEVTATQPTTPETRMTYAEDDGTATGSVGMTVAWEAEEQLAVVSYSGEGTVTPNVLRESLTGGAAGTSTTFSGTIEVAGTGDMAGRYSFYRPVADNDIGVIDNTAKTVTYDYTKQSITLNSSGVGNPNAMSSLDVLYTTAAADPADGITLRRPSSILRLVLQLPANAKVIENIYLNVSSAEFYEKLKLTFAGNGSVTPTGEGDKVSTIRLGISSGDNTSSSPRGITAYMLTPGDITIPAGSVVTISAVAADGTTYTQTVNHFKTSSSATTLLAGKTYTFEPTMLALVDNLSKDDTSNSYIIQEANKKYDFSATVRGNGVGNETFGFTSFPTITKDIAKGNYTASVLWSMGGHSAVAANGVVDDVVYNSSTGRISFTSGASTNGGNALIALKDGSGNVLWSWHIWMNAAFDPDNDQRYVTSATSYGGTVWMMPYNLGAVNTTNTGVSTNAYNDGLLYQWGRKDPFLGARGYANTNPTKDTHYYAAVDFVENGGTSGTPELAYQNPMTFYVGNDTPSGRTNDWVSGAIRYDNLWGNGSDAFADWDTSDGRLNNKYGTKSLFDPCPVGYMVPPRNTWATNFARISGLTFDKGFTFKYNGTDPTFYSASGLRRYSDGSLNNVGSNGSYWSSSPYQAGLSPGGILLLNESVADPLNGNGRASGFSVRCARTK